MSPKENIAKPEIIGIDMLSLTIFENNSVNIANTRPIIKTNGFILSKK